MLLQTYSTCEQEHNIWSGAVDDDGGLCCSSSLNIIIQLVRKGDVKLSVP